MSESFRSNVTPSHELVAKILAALRDGGPAHLPRLMARLGFHPERRGQRVREVLATFANAGFLHVSGWRRVNSPIYCWGPGQSAPRPGKSGTPRGLRSPIGVLILAALEELGPMTREDLALHLGRRPSNVSTALTRLHQIGEVRIARYVHDSESGRRYPRPVWVLGSGPDAPRPTRDRNEVSRRYRANRRAREQMLVVLGRA